MVEMAASSSRERDAAAFGFDGGFVGGFRRHKFGVISLLVVRDRTLVNWPGIVKPRINDLKSIQSSNSLERELSNSRCSRFHAVRFLQRRTFPVENRCHLRQFVRVKLAKYFVLFLAWLWRPVAKRPKPRRRSLRPASQVPTQAQPKLPTLKIYLGAETLDAELATHPARGANRHDVPHQRHRRKCDVVCFSEPFRSRRISG